MNGARLPLWFRASVAALFAALLVLYFFVRQSAQHEAVASALVDRVSRQYAPLLGFQTSAPMGGAQPTSGAYNVNGMRVAYKTIPSPGSADQIFPVLQQMIEKVGFKAKVLTIQDAPTLVGIQPQTHVMVTFRPLRASDGRLYLRISQQNLGDVKPGFVAEIRDVPSLPGAHDPFLVTAVEGAPSQSLMYTASASPTAAADFYRRELARRGWQLIDPPAAPPAQVMATIFFRRLDEEGSVLVVPSGEAGETVVFVTLAGKAT